MLWSGSRRLEHEVGEGRDPGLGTRDFGKPFAEAQEVQTRRRPDVAQVGPRPIPGPWSLSETRMRFRRPPRIRIVLSVPPGCKMEG